MPRQRRSIFDELTKANLVDLSFMLDWITRSAKVDHRISTSQNDRILILAAARQALGGREPVRLFAYIVIAKAWGKVSHDAEDAATAALRVHQRGAGRSVFDVLGISPPIHVVT